MPFFVVSNQPNIAAVADEVLRSRTSAALRAAALTSLRLANPRLDLDNLEPGAVIRIPSLEGGRADIGKDDPLIVAVDDVAARVRDGIKDLLAGSEAAEGERGADKKAAQDLFGTAAVKRLSEQVPQLKENIASVRETFKQDDGVARKQAEELKAAADGWAVDLETLRALLDS